MTWYEFWLFLHLIGVIVWIGGNVAVQAFGILTRRAADPAKSAFFAQNVATTIHTVILPSAVLVLIAGVAMVENAGWDWNEPFIVVGLVGWALVALVAFGYLGRAIGAAGRRLVTDGPSPALGLRLRNLTWASRALLVVLVVIVFVMTVKPGS